MQTRLEFWQTVHQAKQSQDIFVPRCTREGKLFFLENEGKEGTEHFGRLRRPQGYSFHGVICTGSGTILVVPFFPMITILPTVADGKFWIWKKGATCAGSQSCWTPGLLSLHLMSSHRISFWQNYYKLSSRVISIIIVLRTGAVRYAPNAIPSLQWITISGTKRNCRKQLEASCDSCAKVYLVLRLPAIFTLASHTPKIISTSQKVAAGLGWCLKTGIAFPP